jgi:hypothetical protein
MFLPMLCHLFAAHVDGAEDGHDMASARLLPVTCSNWLTLKFRGVPLMSSTPLGPLMLIRPLVRLALVLVAGAMAPLRVTVAPNAVHGASP